MSEYCMSAVLYVSILYVSSMSAVLYVSILYVSLLYVSTVYCMSAVLYVSILYVSVVTEAINFQVGFEPNPAHKELLDSTATALRENGQLFTYHKKFITVLTLNRITHQGV